VLKQTQDLLDQFDIFTQQFYELNGGKVGMGGHRMFLVPYKPTDEYRYLESKKPTLKNVMRYVRARHDVVIKKNVLEASALLGRGDIVGGLLMNASDSPWQMENAFARALEKGDVDILQIIHEVTPRVYHGRIINTLPVAIMRSANREATVDWLLAHGCNPIPKWYIQHFIATEGQEYLSFIVENNIPVASDAEPILEKWSRWMRRRQLTLFV